MMRSALLIICVFALFASSGCATRAGYARTHPMMEKEDREALLDGRVRPGFNQEMVELALGSPSNIESTMTTEGSQELWFYPSSLWLPLFGTVRNEYTYVYFKNGAVSKVRTEKGNPKYQGKMEKSGAAQGSD